MAHYPKQQALLRSDGVHLNSQAKNNGVGSDEQKKGHYKLTHSTHYLVVGTGVMGFDGGAVVGIGRSVTIGGTETGVSARLVTANV